MYFQGTLLIYTLIYTAVFILTWASKSNNSNRLFDEKGLPAKNTLYLIGLHVGGILLLGSLPIFILPGSFNELLHGSNTLNITWLLSFVFLFVLLTVTGFRAGSRIHIKEDNIQILSARFLTQYFIVRILFLCSYELFFRGFMLFDCIKYFGSFTAITVTTLLTVLIHIFTNKKEMWSCIPFGIILSSLCIAIHAVWPAMLLHVALSLAYEIPPVNHYITQLKPSR